MVVPQTFDTDKLDAISHICTGTPPLLFRNEAMPGERQRMTTAHEIGHLILHSTPTPDAEDEADRFAAAFLMPEDDIRSDLCPPLNFGKLAELKARWKVSMQALVVRAKKLGLISAYVYGDLFRQFGARGWRKHEPLPIHRETPGLLEDLLRIHRDEHGYSVDELSKRVSLYPAEFSRIYGTSEGRLRLVQ
jgi:Zn-dependent peptidase ImmA (M78 family)